MSTQLSWRSNSSSTVIAVKKSVNGDVLNSIVSNHSHNLSNPLLKSSHFFSNIPTMRYTYTSSTQFPVLSHIHLIQTQGDRLTIASEQDLNDAVNSTKRQSLRSLRITVTPQNIPFSSIPDNTLSTDLFSENTESVEFHWGTTCSQCKTTPIQGAHYKCCVCSNFHLCPTCEATTDHDPSHPMIKLNVYKNSMWYHTIKYRIFNAPKYPFTFSDHSIVFNLIFWTVSHSEFSRFGVSAHNTMFLGLNELLNNLGLIIQPQSQIQTLHKAPSAMNSSPSSSSSSALSAELLSHQTLPNGTECVMDRIETKTWRVRNNGTTEWVWCCSLCFCDFWKSKNLKI